MPKAWTKKDERMYKKIVRSCRKKRGKVVCERIAAATVNKARAKSGRTKHRTKSCPRGYRKSKGGKTCYRGSKRIRLGGLATARNVSMRTQAVRRRRAEEAWMAGDSLEAERILIDYFAEPGAKDDPHARKLWTLVQHDLEQVERGKKLSLRGTRRGITVDRERLDRGGYTSGGRYFGAGEPLYQWWHEASGEGGHVRARNAKEARAKAEQEIARLQKRRRDVGW
jgi:hypothetical protein